MSTEYVHVTEFIETIFCFSLLVLIGQRFVMTWKGEDEKYLKHRLDELQEEIMWERKHQQKQTTQFQQQRQVPASPQQQYPTQNPPQNPQEPTLKTSLTDYENDQTTRRVSDLEKPEVKSPYKRKSLTDLARQNDEGKPQEIQIKDSSDASSRKPSIDSKQGEDRNRGITNELDRSQIMNENVKYPSLEVPGQNMDIQQQFRTQIRSQMKIQIFALIDTIFNEHLSVLMSMLVLGILTQSTFITSMISLFGYIITHLLIKLKESMGKASKEPQNQSILTYLFPLLPKVWIFVLFINYWAVKEFSPAS